MSSQRKLDSARANGAKSHGPVTAEGKAISSQNGVRHGLLAEVIVLEGESKDRFEQLHAGLTAEFQPCTPTEATLVDTMAIARWRYFRTLDIQKATLDLEMDHQPASREPAHCAAAVFKNLADNSRVLDLLLRYETSFDRQFTRALNTLLKLRAVEPTQPCKPNRDRDRERTDQNHDSDPAPPEQIFPSEPNSKIEHPSAPVSPAQISLAPRKLPVNRCSKGRSTRLTQPLCYTVGGIGFAGKVPQSRVHVARPRVPF